MCACDNHKFKTFHPTVKTQRKDSERGNKGWATALSSSYNMKGNFFGLKQRLMGNFLENDFWTPPFLSILYIHLVDKVGHVAAVPGPLAYPNRSACPFPVLAAALGPEILLS